MGWNDRLRQAAAAFCYVCIALLSSVPGDLRPHVPGFSDKLEHLLAFFALGAITVFAVPRAWPGPWLATAIVTYASALEAGQVFIPGREASIADFAASVAGALLGVGLGLAFWPSVSALHSFRGQNAPEGQKAQLADRRPRNIGCRAAGLWPERTVAESFRIPLTRNCGMQPQEA